MNIRVDYNAPIANGTEVVFKSPADCSKVTGLIVYYPDNGITASKEFAFVDAHGENIGVIEYLSVFGKGAVVKVILDLGTNKAFIQNPDTNAYLEGRLAELEAKKCLVPITGDDLYALGVEKKCVDGTFYIITQNGTLPENAALKKGYLSKGNSEGWVDFVIDLSAGTGGGDSSVVFGYGKPNNDTKGEKGTFYFDQSTRELYLCYDNGAYGENFWHKISVNEDEIVQSVLDALPIYNGEVI